MIEDKSGHTLSFSDIQKAALYIADLHPTELRLAAPLGLGKPNVLLNQIYDIIKNRPQQTLKIYTALSLEPPSFNEEMAKKLFQPIHDRLWGADYPVLKYNSEAKKDLVPDNIHIHEFYFQAGSALNSVHLQRNYQSVNYTHAAENVLRAKVQVIVQLVAFQKTEQGVRYSLSCNPDMTLDVVELYKEQNESVQVIGVLHPDLPFMAGDAEVPKSFFHALVETDEALGKLFVLPRMPISLEDHLIGVYASSWVEDGGDNSNWNWFLIRGSCQCTAYSAQKHFRL